MIQGTVCISTTQYGEVFDFSIPGKEEHTIFLHDNKTGQWFSLIRETLENYNMIFQDAQELPVTFTADDGSIQSLEAGADVRKRIETLLSGGAEVAGDIEFYFTHILIDTLEEPSERTLQEIGVGGAILDENGNGK